MSLINPTTDGLPPLTQGTFNVKMAQPDRGKELYLQFRNALMTVMLLCIVAACSDGSDQQVVVETVNRGPFAELFEQGIIRYLGLFTPMLSQREGNVTTHHFAVDSGPLCANGTPYSMVTRDTGSEDLMIFLEGGGACWSDFCYFVNEVVPGIPQAGLLDASRANNPVKDWSVAYVPNCDGSLLSGDVDVDSDGDGRIDRYQHGLKNLSAALDVAVRTFPAPRRIFLAGQSGGALGLIFSLPLVRYLYPGVPIDVLHDSGVGVLKPGDPALLRKVVSEWNLDAFIPKSCSHCIPADGHLTDLLNWQMDQDPDIRRAMLSYSQDVNLSNLFLKIGGPAFETALLEEMQEQENAHPGRMRSWIADGNGHTFVETDPDHTAGGVPLMDWIGFMLSHSDQWVSVKDASLGH